MADDALNMRARVVDEFSGPLRKLRQELSNMRAPRELARIGDNFKALRVEAKAAGDSIKNVLGGALVGVGAGALAGIGSIAGLTAAMKSFTVGAAESSRVAREVGMSINQLEKMRSFGARIGASGDEMVGSAQKFAQNLYDLRRRTGQMREELLKSGAGGRQLADELFNAKDFQEAYGRAMGFLSRMKDPEQARRLSELLFGSGTLGRVSEMGPAKVAEALKEIGKSQGDMEKAAASARKLEQQFAEMNDKLVGLRNTLMEGALPLAIKSIEDIRNALKDVNWKDFEKGASTALKEVKELADGVLTVVRELSQIIRNDWSSITGLDFYKKHPGAAQLLFGTPGAGTDAGNAMQKHRLEQKADLEKRLEDAKKRGDKAAQIGIERKLEVIADELKKLNDKAGSAGGSGGGLEKMSFGGAGGGAGGLLHMASLGGGGFGGGIRERMRSMGGAVRNSIGAAAASGGPVGKDLYSSIIAAEGTGKFGDPYNTSLGYLKSPKPLTSMTMAESLAWGEQVRRRMGMNSSAKGAFQIVNTTQRRAMAALGMKDTDLFDEGNQRRMAEWIAKTQGLGAWEGFKKHPRALATARAAMSGGGAGGFVGPDGLRVKPGAGTGHQALMSLGAMMQSTGMVNRFTAFRDAFHKGRTGSLHNHGLAGDFSLNDPRMAAQAAEMVRKTMRAAGLTGKDFQVIDEYNNPSKGSTGGHIHYGFRSQGAAQRFQDYYNSRKELADAVRQREAGKIEGSARVDINLQGFPRGTKTNADATGLFKDVKIKRGELMASGGVGV